MNAIIRTYIKNKTLSSVYSQYEFLKKREKCACVFSSYIRKMCTVRSYKNINLMFKDPRADLQQYLEIELLTDKDKCFEPSFESMKASLKLFEPHKDHPIECISRTIDPDRFPAYDLPEVAFLGRSNSGKSSLLKAIFNALDVLRIQTSKKPGHTKSLRFYKVGTCLCLVDMPGYGYGQPEWFQTSVMYYLKNRKNLLKTFLLIDAKEGFHDWDDASLQMLQDLKIPFAVVLTKIDAVSESQRLKNFLHLRNIVNQLEINTCFPQIFLLSATTGEGLAHFMAFIAYITGNLNLK